MHRIHETKSTLDKLESPPSEAGEIEAANGHLKAIGIESYGLSASSQWVL
jgi:hypothetical protein